MIHHIAINEEILNYIRTKSLRESSLLKELRIRTSTHPEHTMQILPEQGQFLSLLIKLIKAKKALEIGVFTGYSAIATASALPLDGKLYACDIDQESMGIAREFWNQAGLSEKIIECIGCANDTLTKLIDEGHADSFDYIFIDADKVNYDNYYEKSLSLLRQGGLLVFDNTLWSGDVANPQINTIETIAIREINDKLHTDNRVDISLLPFADGITLVRKI
jgi:caffeoyl-CoA O-methyltransferase